VLCEGFVSEDFRLGFKTEYQSNGLNPTFLHKDRLKHLSGILNFGVSQFHRENPHFRGESLSYQIQNTKLLPIGARMVAQKLLLIGAKMVPDTLRLATHKRNNLFEAT
jgi:hypothetical protein